MESKEMCQSTGLIYVERYPKSRFFARLLDVSIIVFAFYLLESYMRLKSNTIYAETDSLSYLGTLCWIPIEAVLLATWGTTPGKFLLGIRVRTQQGEKLSLKTAFKRVGLIYSVGQGLMIPYVCSIANLFAYAELTENDKTYWDRKLEIEVSHGERSVGQRRIIYAVTLALLLGMYFAMGYMTKYTTMEILKLNN